MAAESDRIAEAAAEWLARRDAGWRAGEREAFEAWCAVPAHRQAVEELEQTWTMLARPRTKFSETVIGTLAGRARRRRRRRLGWGAMACAAVLAVWLGNVAVERVPEPVPIAASDQVALRPHRQLLEDGSVVELNSHAVVDIDYSAQQRRVVLRRGIAHFAVAKDPARPFIVAVGPTTVRAVGTEFTVEVAAKSVEVLVSEGKVDVAPEAAVERAPVRLEAGLRASVPVSADPTRRADVSQASSADIARAHAWRAMRVEFTEMPLAEAVALFNRRNALQLELGDAEIGRILVSGICWIDNPRAFARMLEATFGLDVEESGTRRLLLKRGITLP